MFKNFNASSLPPCEVELRQQFWRNLHLKFPTSLTPKACSETMNNNKYDFVWFLGDRLQSLVADIIVHG